MRSVLLGALLVVSVVLQGCSGANNAVDDERTQRDESTDVRKFEDFDPAPYEDDPTTIGVEIVHSVPESLMNSTAGRDARSVRTIQGFRIQIHSSLDKSAAVEKEEFAREWWRSIPEDERPVPFFGSELPTYLRYVEPYYRVRVGDFEHRGDAETALEFIRTMFPGAFIAIDTVTIVR